MNTLTDAAQVLTSEVLAAAGIPHCFSTRLGGVSLGMFESLNLGNPSELPREQRDPLQNIRENFRRILAAIGCEGRIVTEVHQVHGGAVHAALRGGSNPEPDPKADAIVSDDPGRALVIRIADCAPVLLATPDGRMVGAVHAGWRGVIAGVLLRAIGRMRDHGAGELLAAIGPCIGPESFEVGPEVVEQFARAFPDDTGTIIRSGLGHRSFVDLKEALRRQLLAAGITRLDVSPRCTFLEADLFFSHRREGGLTGRMGAVISVRA
jgi:purine-nucleoside/S-methyl-5'-thioadenosine phosphorylase / adenosine deaminase